MASATPVKGWLDWALTARKDPLTCATHIIILLESSLAGVDVILQREQNCVRGVLQRNLISQEERPEGEKCPTIWDTCVCRIDAGNSGLDLFTEALKAISGSDKYPQLFLMEKPKLHRDDIAAETPLPIPLSVATAVPMFGPDDGKPSELVFELNEHERTRQAITDLFAKATGVDDPSMWMQMTMPSGDSVWVNQARYRKPASRSKKPDLKPAASAAASASAAGTTTAPATVEEIVIRDPTETPEGEHIERGSRNLRYSRPLHRGGLVWEEIKLLDGTVFWENRITREVQAAKPAEADTLTLTAEDMDKQSTCTVC